MKKSLTMFIFFVCLAMLIPSIGFAGSGSLTSPANPTNLQSFQLSKGVTITYDCGANSYGLITSHQQGDTLFGGGSNDSAVYRTKTGKTEGAAYTTVPTTSDSSQFHSGWTAM